MTSALIRPLAAAFMAVAVLVSLAGCGKSGPVMQGPPAVMPVTVQTLASKRIRDVVELDGSVSASKTVNLVAVVAGTLQKIGFREGERVKAGQLLFLIDQGQYKANLLSSQANLDKCQADYKRQTELLAENANSQANVETSLANMKQAVASVQLAQINLDYTEVRAPFDGVIGRTQVDAGNYVGATQGGTLLATLMKVSPAYVYASIGEREAIRMRRGGAPTPGADGSFAKVFARLQGESGDGEPGVLDFIDHQVNQTSGTVQVRGRFDNRDLHLVPGFYAKLTIEKGSERDALLLPRELVLSDQQGEYVFVVGTDGLAHRKNVTTVLLPGEQKEVTSGLAAGERVVDKGANRLTDGQAVEVVDPGQAG